MSSALVETIPKPFLSCNYCQRNVLDGWIGINVTLAKRRKVVCENYESGLPVFLPIPPLIPWEILHSRCSEQMNRAEPSADEYRIDASSIKSTNDVLALTAELMKKDWLVQTTWRLVLRRIQADTLFNFDLKAEKRRKKAELVKAG
jgi:hypothetical protein